MNKKGIESFTMMQAIPRFLFLIVLLFSIIFLVRAFVVDNLNVQSIQAEVFVNKILYSPNSISHNDKELGILIPGLIDPSKIKDETLDNFMDYKDESFIAGKVQLFDANNVEVKSAIYNKKTYERWLPLAQFGKKGIGGVKRIGKSVFVNYIGSDKNILPGTLKFDVLLPGN